MDFHVYHNDIVEMVPQLIINGTELDQIVKLKHPGVMFDGNTAQVFAQQIIKISRDSQ